MSAMPKIAISISVDRSKALRDQPRIGHNRWHPDIRPIAEVSPGEVVSIETLDAIFFLALWCEPNARTTIKSHAVLLKEIGSRIRVESGGIEWPQL